MKWPTDDGKADGKSMTHPPTGRRRPLRSNGVITPLVLALCGLWSLPGAAGAQAAQAERVAAGMAAHTLCSATFVSGLTPEDVVREHVALVLGVEAEAVDYVIDRAGGSVTAQVAGSPSATARFEPGFGCRLETRSDGRRTPPPPLSSARSPDSTPGDPALAAALDAVFAERAGDPVKAVKAVVVVRAGQVVAERYAEGVDAETPLLGYSVAKSVTNALLGVLVRQGRLDVRQPVEAPEWSGRPASPFRPVTLEDLLRMQSGIDAPEAQSAESPVARMLFIEDDMAGYAASRPLAEAPGVSFDYTSANTLILARVIGETVGGGAPGLRAFAERELFAPLGMTDVTMEFDGRGVFVGSSFIYATARDYARFGQLYLNDGLAPDGRRILPKGWVEWSRRSTLGAPYGAGFWTNDGPSEPAASRIRAGFPADGFFASGVLGQRIYIVPSADLVIVRLGHSAPPDFGVGDDLALIAAAVAAAADADAGAEGH